MNIPFRALAYLSLPAAVLLGCNQGATDPDIGKGGDPEARQAAYSEEVLKMKASTPDYGLRAEKAIELQKKYGFEVDPDVLTGGFRATDAPVPAPAQALGKTAASRTLVKNYDLYIRRTYLGEVAVNRNATVTITANAIGTADPFLALYKLYSCGPCYGNFDLLKYDDDGAGGLNSRVTWTNTSTQTLPVRVQYIVFSANGAAGIGNVNLVINNGGTVTNINNVPARGNGAVMNNAGTAPCAEPFASEIIVSSSQSSSLPFFAMNAGAAKRGTIRYGGYTWSWWIPGSTAAGNPPNFVVPYYSDSSPEVPVNLKQYDECN